MRQIVNGNSSVSVEGISRNTENIAVKSNYSKNITKTEIMYALEQVIVCHSMVGDAFVLG